MLLLLFACSPAADSPSGPRPELNDRGAGGPLGVQPLGPAVPVDARPAALVSGRMVEWGELRPLLNEAAGGTVLGELVLDRVVTAAAAREGVAVGAGDLEAERRLFYEALDGDPDRAVQLANQLRDRQGLGPARFERLLRRNAMLRALVRGQVTVSEESVRRMHESMHGPRRQARLIVVGTLLDAQAAIRRIEGGESFTDVAVELSTDFSAPRGGLLEPISRVDPRYPEALRRTLWALEPGGVSNPVLLEGGYAILLLVREVDADGVSLEDARPRLEALVRLEQERILMDRRARELVMDASVTVIDDDLQWSWEARRRERSP